ncbi:MAG: hypothetical protein H0W84_01895 [Bacteroidetes bacterium]|nr:hypothetical protein [Bacteroidota bacterium]
MEKNKKQKRLTIEELKKFNGFENYSDDQAKEIIKPLGKLSIVFYELYKQQKLIEEKFESEMKIRNLNPTIMKNNETLLK